jgi:hypothetical protein
VRDEVVDAVLVRKNNVCLSFSFGWLNLRHSGVVEFKSSSPFNFAEEEPDKMPACPEFENASCAGKARSQAPKDSQSQQSITERSLHFMQQR